MDTSWVLNLLSHNMNAEKCFIFSSEMYEVSNFSSEMYEVSNFSPSCQHDIICNFDYSYLSGCEVVFHLVLVCTTLMTNNGEHIFI